tara:strand:- start:6 stop:854 length:849 start_codon:yes stop_codon:yes gene_type:complete
MITLDNHTTIKDSAIKQSFLNEDKVIEYFYIVKNDLPEDKIKNLIQNPGETFFDLNESLQQKLKNIFSPFESSFSGELDEHEDETNPLPTIFILENLIKKLISLENRIIKYPLNISYEIIKSNRSFITCNNEFFPFLISDIPVEEDCLKLTRNYIEGELLPDMISIQTIDNIKSEKDIENIVKDDDKMIQSINLKNEYISYIKWQTNAFILASEQKDIILWCNKFAPDNFIYNKTNGFTLFNWSHLMFISLENLKKHYQNRIETNNLPLYSSTVLEILEKNG